MAQDSITGTWSATNKPNIASWILDDSSLQGFGTYDNKGKGKLYYDKNNNGKLDKKDKVIGSLRITDAATDQNNPGYGTFLADPQIKSVSFLNPAGIELAVGTLTNLSYF